MPFAVAETLLSTSTGVVQGARFRVGPMVMNGMAKRQLEAIGYSWPATLRTISPSLSAICEPSWN
jgi:hypothetical protein